MSPDKSADTPRNKVAQVIQQRGLEGLGTRIERRWSQEDGHSVRELTKSFNERVLEDALSQAGIVPLKGEIENMYELLTTDERATSKQQVQERYNLSDIDLDEVTADFVSHQTMYRYLTNVRNLSKETTTATLDEQIQSVKQAAQKMQGRLSSMVSSNLAALSKKEGFYTGDIEVTVSVTVSCRMCNKNVSLLNFLDDNGCECTRD